jgi:hypothetical protein
LSRSEQRELERAQTVAGLEFMEENETYYATPTNARKLGDYLKAKGKPITKKNLTVAFNQLVAAGDKHLIRTAAPEVEVVDPTLSDVPPPPTVVPSNQGLPPDAGKPEVDVVKFASMSLKEQQEFFSKLRRR